MNNDTKVYRDSLTRYVHSSHANSCQRESPVQCIHKSDKLLMPSSFHAYNFTSFISDIFILLTNYYMAPGSGCPIYANYSPNSFDFD